MNHFYYGSAVNCVSVSGMTVEEVKAQMAKEIQAYALEIVERGGKSEQIKASDIGLRYESDEQVKALKDKQKAFAWISAFSSTQANEITLGVTYDEEVLKSQIDKLACFSSSNVVEPKNAGFKYTDSAYVIVDEVMGNKIDKEIFIEKVSQAIRDKKTSLDLESINCYVNPQYTSKSDKVVETKNLLNKYVSSKVTYTFGDNKEALDGSTINQWINVDGNYVITLDEGKVKGYVEGMANKYNTLGRTRSFATSSGRTINVSGGDYGWAISIDKEAQSLTAAIKEGQTITKEPKYSQTAYSRGSNDIGNTYVEIDMSRQHLWFYKNGALVVEGNVVTGNVSAGHTTPGGTYSLKYKEKNAVLRGPDYEAPVTFWMPFNGGIGIHDASWRNEFGGEIYKTNGSHGCVNSPYFLANKIFDNIDAGTPIVCYY